MKVWVTLAVMAASLALILALGLWAGRYIRTETEEMTAFLEQAGRYALSGDAAACSRAFEAFCSRWTQKRSLWLLVMDCRDSREIDNAASGVRALLKSGETGEALAQIEGIIATLKHFARQEQVDLYHIF